MCLVISVFLPICDNNHRSGGKKNLGSKKRRMFWLLDKMICVFRYGGTLRLPKWFLAQNFHSKPGI